MKTLIPVAPMKTIRTLLAGFSFMIILLVSGSAFAQTTQPKTLSFEDNKAYHSQTTDALKVAVFPMANSLSMKVVFENPAKENITVLIKNSEDQVVYQKTVGRTKKYIGTFDLTQIGNGTYTMEIKSANQRYSNPFSVETQTDRIARAL